jgi:ribosome-associated toxin RatA of RatAB toxin-antitoxin module
MLRSRFVTEDVHRDFQRVADFGLFPSLAEDVRAVDVHPAPSPDVPRDSDWEVNFRRGVMRWNEWESVDPARLRIEFDQTDGDFSEFHGSWQLVPVHGAAEVVFEVTYDFGIESLAGIMDPIAERVVKRVICSVLTELFGEIQVLEGGEALVDLAGMVPEGYSERRLATAGRRPARAVGAATTAPTQPTTVLNSPRLNKAQR